LRALLQEEAARVQRNLAEYAHPSQSAMQSTRIIAESPRAELPEAELPTFLKKVEALVNGLGEKPKDPPAIVRQDRAGGLTGGSPGSILAGALLRSGGGSGAPALLWFS
jgi:hypothetical protein